MTKSITAAGNTVAPAILALEAMGFAVQIESVDRCRAVRDDEIYQASDPIEVLGLVQLVLIRGWDWRATDEELAAINDRHGIL